MAFRLRRAPYWERRVAVIMKRTTEHKFLVEVTAAHQRNLDRWIHAPFQGSLSDFQHESNLFAYPRCTVLLCVSTSFKQTNENETTSLACTEGVLKLWYSNKKDFLTCGGFGFRCKCRRCQRVSQCHWNVAFCPNWVHRNVLFWLVLKCNTTSSDEILGEKKMHYYRVTTVI